MCCTLRRIPQWISLCSYRSIHHISSDAQQNNAPSAYLKSYTGLRIFFPFSLQMEKSHRIVKRVTLCVV